MSDNPGNPLDVTKVAAALTGVIGVFAALAVTGVVGQAQRNHGVMLVIALGLVLIGAISWLLAAVVGGQDAKAAKDATFFLGSVALVTIASGLLLGIVAIWKTQKDSERPSVSATFDPATGVAAVTASGHGLRTDSRLVVVVSGFRGTPNKPTPQNNPPTLYYAVVGPNSDGDVTQTASVPVPGKYKLVGVKAWTGKEPTECKTVNEDTGTDTTPQHDRVGCLLLQIR